MLRWFTETGGERFNVSAELVKSVRVDGKVRQKFVASLGSYQEAWIQVGDHYVLDFKPDETKFWTKVWQKLHTLGLDPDEQARIEAKLAEKVPQPDRCRWSPPGWCFAAWARRTINFSARPWS